MNCVIIDDEPLARKLIKNYCNSLIFIKVVAECKSALEAVDFLNNNDVDLLFLDINMPKLKGLDFLRTLPNPPLVIVTTAYQEYAVDSYELNVIDYLLKPFSFERFLKAVNKAQTQLKLISSSNTYQDVKERRSNDFEDVEMERIFIKGDKKTHQVLFSEIIYLESYGSYVKIHLENETIITLERLANFEEKLPSNLFIRIHRSYVVAVKKIQTIEGNQVKVNGKMLPVGSVFKHNLLDLFK
jgi:DNA-binding LytR/AlgR family response regulator